MSPRPRTRRRTRLYAHRGASGVLPENSMAAFARGLDDGATALELDIHRTGDGHFVVSHDADGLRTAGEPRRIRSIHLADVRRWRLTGAPHHPDPLPSDATTLPTLEEVLDAFTDTPMSIDVKFPEADDLPPLLELLHRQGAEDRVTLASFHDAQVFRIRRLGWAGRTALTRLEVAWMVFAPFAAWCGLIRGHAAQIPTSTSTVRLDTPRFMQRCRRLGLRCDYWVVNEPERARRLLSDGATGIMTDHPAVLRPALDDLLGGDPTTR